MLQSDPLIISSSVSEILCLLFYPKQVIKDPYSQCRFPKKDFLYNNGNRSKTRGSDYQFQKHPFLTHFLPVFNNFRFPLQKAPFERPGVNELMILHFLQRNEIYEQSTVLTTKTAMLCALFVFFQVRVRLRVGGRPCEPFPASGLSAEPFPPCSQGSPYMNLSRARLYKVAISLPASSHPSFRS